jgi:2-polyprenyl-3-methyl-5-hydroxy-6-metoxy-1,4-benzoquinol methylase
MSEIVQYCPLCKSEHGRLFDSRSFHGKAVVNRICLDCGLVFQSPRMTEAESAAFYGEEYRLFNEGSLDPTTRNMATQHARAESLLAFTGPLVEKVSRHLDIGCSMGILLQRFAENYHCQPAGIEPGEAHRARARKEGLTVYASLDELEKAGTGRFNLISMSHVLEHLPDPVGYLVHLRETLLDTRGWLLLEVPNLYAHDSFEVAHLVSYSCHTLFQTLKKSRFRSSQDRTARTTEISLAAALYYAAGTPRNNPLPIPAGTG